jgi:hypothetical protein
MLAQQTDEDARIAEEVAWARQIEAAGPKQNLGVLQEVLKGVEERADDPERYAVMVQRAFLALHVKGTEDRDLAARLQQKYLLAALDRRDRISTLTELGLVRALRPNVPSTEVAGKDELRTKVDLLFHAWRRLEQDIKPDFNFADKFEINVSPPIVPGEGVISGMDPMGIKDSRLRAEYQAAIEKNRVKAEEYNRQFELRREKPLFIDDAEDFLLSALEVDPGVEGVVISNLTLVRDNEARERVLAKVRSRFDER